MRRFAEPSTWAGIGILFQVLKAFIPPSAHIFADALSAGAAGIAGVLPEKAKAE